MEILFLIFINIISRLTPHLPNMTPVGGMAIFTGSKYRLGISVFIIGISMICSDFVLGFHSVMWATYGSIFIAILLGRLLKKQKNWRLVAIVTVISTLQFFIVTNFAVWSTGVMYPKTIEGLFRCYIMALPFLRNSLIGDVVYSALFFGFSYYGAHLKRCVYKKEVAL